jgi:hypothetical protein
VAIRNLSDSINFAESSIKCWNELEIAERSWNE